MILFDLAVQRQVLLERFKANQVRKYTKTLRQVDATIRAQLAGPNLTDFRRSRLNKQLQSLNETLKGQFHEYTESLNVELKKLGVVSADLEAGTLNSYTPTVDIATPSPNQIWTAITVEPLSMTGPSGAPLLEAFMENWESSDADMVTAAIRQGYMLGETNAQISTRIRGTAAQNYADGVLATNRQHADTVTRTAIQHTANTARASVWAANDDIIEEYEIVATLDTRTTTICRSLDGKKFPVGKGPMPPFHPNCRTTTVAVIMGEFGQFLGEESTRESVNGQVPANETYYEWLKRQKPDFQDIALGPTRGQLFRDGGLSVEKFASLQLGKNFQPMTLDQMRKAVPKAFKKARIA